MLEEKVYPMCLVWPPYEINRPPSECITEVTIETKRTVSTLQNMIMLSPARTLNQAASQNISLWKCAIPADEKLEETLNTIRFDGTDTRLQKLPPSSPIYEFFEADLPIKTVHVLVKVEQVSGSLKHRRSSDSSEHQLLKRAKLGMVNPSQLGMSATYRSLQQSTTQKILDDRPKLDIGIAPIELLYDGFGIFMDIIHGHTAVSEEPGFLQFHEDVEVFADTMSKSYASENLRRTEVDPFLNAIFKAFNSPPPVIERKVGKYTSDGHELGAYGEAVVVREWKNEVNEINALPEVEALGYVTQINILMGDQRQWNLLERYRIPCLILTLVGHEIGFYAAVTLGHRQRLVYLTKVSCLQSATGRMGRTTLRNAFAAAVILRRKIIIDSQNIQDPPLIGREMFNLPACSQLRKWPNVEGSNETFRFVIEEPFLQSEDYRYTYIARRVNSPNEKIVVIKFCHSYCIDLHQYCFERGHAPEIFGFERLPGGWYGIAMEFAHGLPMTKATPTLRKELKDLVKGFHGRNLVHGDLRSTNILSDDLGERFWVIDYDWGGECGKAKYPMSKLNSDLTTGRDPSWDSMIRKEDDDRILEITLDKCPSA